MSAKNLEAYLAGHKRVVVEPEHMAAFLGCTKRQYYRELQRLTKLRVVNCHRRVDGKDIIWRSTDADCDQRV